MTRKRYIKLLMAQGLSKQEAILLVKQANRMRQSYEDAFANYRLERLKKTFDKLVVATGQATVGVEELANGLKALLTAICLQM